MTETVTYAYYPAFRRGDLAGLEESEAAREWEVLFKEAPVEVRGFYSAEGFRPDADLVMWWVADSPDAHQDTLVALRRTALGQRLELTHAFMGAVRPPEFNPDHQPSFMTGKDPKTYLCVYPFVRDAEWYLIPSEERAEMLREHGVMGREFPDILPNTTSAFGLGDWEWILAFEADEMHRIVDCIHRLRDAAARRHTEVEIPFLVGIRKDLAQVVADLF